MTEGFFWGGFNIRKFCRQFFNDFWMVIVVMIIAYLGLGFVGQLTNTQSYTSTAIAAVSPFSSSYHHYSLETASELASKSIDVDSVINSTLFQSGLHNQAPDLQDCMIEISQVENTNLLVINSTSADSNNAFNGIWAALDYYSKFSSDMTGAPEIKILHGPEAPILVENSSKIMSHRSFLCVLAGLMMAGLLLIIYVLKNTYKTERCIRNRYKNIRFFSLPFIKSRSDNKKKILLKKKKQEPIKKVALEIKQLMHKCKKRTLLVTSYADKEGGNVFLSELTRELAEQNENVLLIGTKAEKQAAAAETDASDDRKKTLLDVLQHKCSLKDAMIYSEELKAHCIQYSPDHNDSDTSFTVDEARHILSDCLGYADIILVNGAACYPSEYEQSWQEAVDASIALCRQEDADFKKVDQMLSDLQKGDPYFAGCVLFGF